ncbi:MAG TPA: hypothetical protein VFW52_03645 [Candidatus Saccharimonadales bacterium]|nr:hypothetical protein [Candidatus Saccharimonadales bacterium]
MTLAFLAGAILFGIIILFALSRFGRRIVQPMNRKYFDKRWSEILGRVKTPEGMALAVIDADKLLDEALKRRGYKGKTMGERLVAAQRDLSNNDAVWYAHKLRNRLVHEPNVRLRKNDAKNALAGIKQSLQDLGAL